jgi:molecular chaperone DnaK
VGAAVQAGILKGEVKDLVLLDVTPLSLGIETRGGTFTKIIERNSTIPTRKGKSFTTVADNQTKVQIHVLQGEREIAAHNKALGQFELVGLPPAPRGTPQIEVSFDIDSNGIVSVQARDVATQREQKILVTPSSGLSEDEVLAIIEDAQRNSDEDHRRVEYIRAKARLEGLVDSNQKTFNEFGSMLDEERQQQVRRVLSDARHALESGSASECTDALEKIAEMGKILSEVILYDPGSFSSDGGEVDSAEEA